MLIEHQELQATISSIDPNTGALVGTVSAATVADVHVAVAQARAARPAWARRPLHERIAVLARAQELLIAHADELVALSTREVGKLESEALGGDLLLAINSLNAYLRLAPKVLAPRRLPSGPLHYSSRLAMIFEPWGVVALISPFNYPYLLSIQTIAAALLTGNAVVHKPSELAPLCALRVADLFVEAGVPRDLLAVLVGGREIGHALVEAEVDHITFIGGSQTGRAIARAAGERLIPVNLELGGNNAMIVLDDAPLDRAAACAVMYATSNSGQACSAVSRLLVHEAVAGPFIERIQAGLATLRVRPDTGPTSDLAALASAEALAHAERRVREAVTQGARVVAGGGRLEGTDAPVMCPTLLADVTPEMEIMREETFAPVFSIMPVRDDAEAVRIANATPYGLTASVWTRNRARGWSIARQLEVGSVALNDHVWPFYAPEALWGGVKGSGTGRTGGAHGLLALTYPKMVSEELLNMPREFYWKPYAEWLYPVYRQMLPLLFSRRFGARLSALARLLALPFGRGSRRPGPQMTYR